MFRKVLQAIVSGINTEKLRRDNNVLLPFSVLPDFPMDNFYDITLLVLAASRD